MPGKFEVKPAAKGQFMFNLKAGNSEVILTSELYKTKESCLNGVESVRKNSQDDAMFERKESSNKKPFFVLKATNGQTIGKSEMYESKASMERGIASVKRNAPEAKLVEIQAASA
jgi:uncharacterized protein YegP (UPF0339 family)